MAAAVLRKCSWARGVLEFYPRALFLEVGAGSKPRVCVLLGAAQLRRSGADFYLYLFSIAGTERPCQVSCYNAPPLPRFVAVPVGSWLLDKAYMLCRVIWGLLVLFCPLWTHCSSRLSRLYWRVHLSSFLVIQTTEYIYRTDT